MAEVDVGAEPGEPDWRERAVARSLQAARSRAEERVQRFLDAAFELIDEKGSTDFTIQEIVDHSKQSLRSFYEYFSSKDELVLALFEETVHEAVADIRAAVDAETEPLARLRAFAVTLYQWCDPHESHATGGAHDDHRRRALSEFSTILAANHADRVRAALRPQTRLLRELVRAAADAGAIHATDMRRATAQVQLTVMYHAFGNRLAERPGSRLDAETTWQFCLHGLGG
jgi:AcrR family transcriptional regulator